MKRTHHYRFFPVDIVTNTVFADMSAVRRTLVGAVAGAVAGSVWNMIASRSDAANEKLFPDRFSRLNESTHAVLARRLLRMGNTGAGAIVDAPNDASWEQLLTHAHNMLCIYDSCMEQQKATHEMTANMNIYYGLCAYNLHRVSELLPVKDDSWADDVKQTLSYLETCFQQVENLMNAR